MTPQQLSDIHAASFTHPRPWSADEFSDLLQSPNSILCHQAGGFALGRIAGDEMELLTIATAPEYRRRGIASQLMQKLEAAALGKSVTTVFLEVAQGNPHAIALYHRCGFAQVGLRKNYYTSPSGQSVSAIVMSKTL